MSRKIHRLPGYTLIEQPVDSPEALVETLKAADTTTRDQRKQAAIDTQPPVVIRTAYIARHWLRPRRTRKGQR